MPGSHRDNWGKHTIRPKNKIQIDRKGNSAFIRSVLEMLKTLLVRNRLMPIGGVINPISMFTLLCFQLKARLHLPRIEGWVYINQINNTIRDSLEDW